MKRALLLSGGGFKGAFQVPIIEQLMQLYTYDLILGVSVGAINGVLAAQNQIPLLKEIWAAIDDDNPINGIKGFMNVSLLGGRGLFNLNPVRDLLKKHVSLAKIKIPYGCGAVIRETHEYVTLDTKSMKDDRDLHDSVLASSAIAVLHDPINMLVKGKMRTLSDGGHRHVIPYPPEDFTHIDVVPCFPMAPEPKDRIDVSSLMDAASWAAEMQLEANRFQDMILLKSLADAGICITVYPPKVPLGSLMKADQKTLLWRMDQGRESLKNPIKL